MLNLKQKMIYGFVMILSMLGSFNLQAQTNLPIGMDTIPLPNGIWGLGDTVPMMDGRKMELKVVNDNSIVFQYKTSIHIYKNNSWKEYKILDAIKIYAGYSTYDKGNNSLYVVYLDTLKNNILLQYNFTNDVVKTKIIPYKGSLFMNYKSVSENIQVYKDSLFFGIIGSLGNSVFKGTMDTLTFVPFNKKGRYTLLNIPYTDKFIAATKDSIFLQSGSKSIPFNFKREDKEDDFYIAKIFNSGLSLYFSMSYNRGVGKNSNNNSFLYKYKNDTIQQVSNIDFNVQNSRFLQSTQEKEIFVNGKDFTIFSYTPADYGTFFFDGQGLIKRWKNNQFTISNIPYNILIVTNSSDANDSVLCFMSQFRNERKGYKWGCPHLVVVNLDKYQYQPYTSKSLSINNISMPVLNSGSMSNNYDNSNSNNNYPKNSFHRNNILLSMWESGYIKDSLCINQETYLQNYSVPNFTSGPLDTLMPKGNPSLIKKYNKVWSISQFSIDSFKSGLVSCNDYDDIMSWPAYEKNLFNNKSIYYDANANGIYDPDPKGGSKSDYPLIRGDKSLYFINNSYKNLSPFSNSGNTGVENRIMVYALNCPTENDTFSINNAIFYHIETENKSSQEIKNFKYSNFLDIDYGNYFRDFVGYDTLNSAAYFYKTDKYDSSFYGYQANIPIFSLMSLKGPEVDSLDKIDNNNNGTIDEAGETVGYTNFTYYDNDFTNFGNPELDIHYRNYQDSKWKSGKGIVNDGSKGQTSGVSANFMYTGDPLAKKGWYQSNNDPPADRRFVVSYGGVNIKPNKSKSYDFVFLATYDKNGNGASSFIKQRKDLKIVRDLWDYNLNLDCAQTNAIESQNKSNILGLKIFPNPAKERINIQSAEKLKEISIYSLDGKLIEVYHPNDYNSGLPLENLQNGMFILKIVSINGNRSSQLIEKQ